MTCPKSGGLRRRAIKPSASSDCSSGGSTATMSSPTASLIADPCLLIGRRSVFERSGHPVRVKKTRQNKRLVQPRRLEQFGTIGRGQHYIEGDALMIDRERHIDAGGAERPELAVETGLARDLFAVHSEDDVAGLEFGTRPRAPGGDADHHDLVVDLGGIHAQPWPCRLVDPAEFPQVVEYRLEQVDRH